MRKIIITTIVLLVTLGIQAQRIETVTRFDTLDVDYKTKYTSSFFDNIYLQGAFAGRVLNGEEDSHASFFKERLQPGFQIAVGKKLYPTFGVRFSFGGARLNGWNTGQQGLYQGTSHWTEALTDPLKQYYESQGISTANGYLQKLKYFEFNGDFMVDLLNVFRKNYRFDNPWGLDAYLGVAWVHLTKWHAMPVNDKMAFRIGAIGTYNITDRLGVNLEANIALTDATFDGEIGKGMQFNNYVSAFVGLTYRIGRQGFRVVRLISPESYAALNNRVSLIRSQVDAVPEEIIRVTDQVTEISLLIPSVVFESGKDTFNEELQMVNIFKVAKFMEENKDQDVTIIGNAVGNDQSLARKRAQIVKDILVNRYAIAPNRLTVTVQDVNNAFKVTGDANSVNFSITQ